MESKGWKLSHQVPPLNPFPSHFKTPQPITNKYILITSS
jgi:hypothetical protein